MEDGVTWGSLIGGLLVFWPIILAIIYLLFFIGAISAMIACNRAGRILEELRRR